MAALDDERVQPALQAILEADPNGLRAAIAADPEIVTVKWGENTLLEWTTQPPHGATSEIVDVLIAGGSALDRPLNLAGCWNLAKTCQQLLGAGANPSIVGAEGVTPLESAAMHGATRSADVLSPHGLHRASLWLAAAAGQLAQVQQWVDSSGQLLRDPGSYRPNLADVGHPPGGPASNDPADIIGEAVVFAGANNRMDVVDYLVSVGADIDARPYLSTTALHFAVMFHNPDAVGGLLERGAGHHIVDHQHDGDAHGWAQACLDGSPASRQVADLLQAAR